MATTNPPRPATDTEPRADREEGRLAATRHAAEEVASNLASAADTVRERLPEAAATTRAAVDEATRRMRTGSDEMLTVGASFSLGMAIGLLVGGANRLLVVLSLIPAAAMGMTLLDREGARRGRGQRVTGQT